MQASKAKQLSTEPYKGVRDFYPEDKRVQEYLFSVMRASARSFGYEEYDASILEPAELYMSKSGEELAGEQTYTFTDRGGREVSLRPEMTPTAARMVARRVNDLTFPLRWFSIPNLFRYERPQRGRAREHFQFNADIFGVDGMEADAEIIALAADVMRRFGANSDDFLIRLNSRRIIDDLYGLYSLDAGSASRLSRIIDKKKKMEPEAFAEAVREVLGGRAEEFVNTIESDETLTKALSESNENIRDMIALMEKLDKRGVKNVIFDPTVVRGLDYYTGFVFEIFDTNPENRRSLFGGGRYDNLLGAFIDRAVPAVGFGMGDISLLDFLETHDLLAKPKPATDLYICRVDAGVADGAEALAARLRERGVNAALDITDRKVGDQIKYADKKGIPYVVCVGKEEIGSGRYKLKELLSGEERELSEDELAEQIKK